MKRYRPRMSPEKIAHFFEHYVDHQDALSESLKDARQRARVRKYASAALWYLDQGLIRVWNSEARQVNVWAKIAILAHFQTAQTESFSAGCFEYADKLPVKRRSALKGVRVVPGAVVRYGAYIEPGAIVMPGFVNVGACVGRGTMIDTWATVGSCAQVGAQVHLSGGVGIGGVLEPVQASPVVIEDGAFIGSRAVVVEGVQIGAGAVLGAGVVLTASTHIIDVRGSNPIVTKGAVPARAVVIPGTYPKQFPAGEFGAPCVLWIGDRRETTDLKTSLNAALRDFNVAV